MGFKAKKFIIFCEYNATHKQSSLARDQPNRFNIYFLNGLELVDRDYRECILNISIREASG